MAKKRQTKTPSWEEKAKALLGIIERMRAITYTDMKTGELLDKLHRSAHRVDQTKDPSELRAIVDDLPNFVSPKLAKG